MIFAAERWRQSHQKSHNGLSATARDVANPASALVSIIAERKMLNADGSAASSVCGGPANQEPDVNEAHLEQPCAEPVPPGPVPSRPSRAESVVLYSFSPPIRPGARTLRPIWSV